MKRSYPSGAEKKKKKKQAKRLRASLPKLTSFFKAAEEHKEAIGEESEEALNDSDSDAAFASDDEDSDAVFSSEEEEAQTEQVPAVPAVIIPDDPALWPGKQSNRERCDIIIIGPVQVNDYAFPQNNDNPPRRFTTTQYVKKMKNGESVQRKRLVYSTSSDAVYCFCCMLFGEGANALCNQGYSTWSNIVKQLKDHESSFSHRDNIEKWHNLAEGLKAGTTIDRTSQTLHALKVQQWKDVISRLKAIICHLAEHNLALRGRIEKLYQPHNGNFLGQVELMAKFELNSERFLRRK